MNLINFKRNSESGRSEGTRTACEQNAFKECFVVISKRERIEGVKYGDQGWPQ
jgi:hypothetical protein